MTCERTLSNVITEPSLVCLMSNLSLERMDWNVGHFDKTAATPRLIITQQNLEFLGLLGRLVTPTSSSETNCDIPFSPKLNILTAPPANVNQALLSL